MGIAAAVGVVVFLILMTGGFFTLLQCACRCPCSPSAAASCLCGRPTQLCRICSLGFQRTCCYRMTAYGCLLCYAKCCKRSKRYYDKMMVRSRKMLDNLENDMETELAHLNRPLSADEEEDDDDDDDDGERSGTVTLIIDEL